MTKALSVSDLDPSVKEKVYTQDYAPAPLIEGVKIVKLTTFSGEDGDFSELFRLTGAGEPVEFPGFRIAQINRSKLIGGAIKAWHIHFQQDEIWYCLPPNELLLGLWDLRNNSPTNGKTMRIPLGSGNRLIYIPRGVAHGAVNLSHKPTQILYFVTELFNPKDPDEHRLPWDSHGAEFWSPKRE